MQQAQLGLERAASSQPSRQREALRKGIAIATVLQRPLLPPLFLWRRTPFFLTLTSCACSRSLKCCMARMNAGGATGVDWRQFAIRNANPANLSFVRRRRRQQHQQRQQQRQRTTTNGQLLLSLFLSRCLVRVPLAPSPTVFFCPPPVFVRYTTGRSTSLGRRFARSVAILAAFCSAFTRTTILIAAAAPPPTAANLARFDPPLTTTNPFHIAATLHCPSAKNPITLYHLHQHYYHHITFSRDENRGHKHKHTNKGEHSAIFCPNSQQPTTGLIGPNSNNNNSAQQLYNT